jgi:glucuronoarabinoxylan endo-1,4-beta-xylanase
MLHHTAPTQAVSGVTIDGVTTYQVIDGFGFSEAFQRSNELQGSLGLSSAKQQQILDLPFNPHIGTGFTLLHTITDFSLDPAADHVSTIEPHRPGAPSASPTFDWDSSDQSHIWLSHQEQRYGVTQIIAATWSALGTMKTNGSASSGGICCDVPGVTCAGED